MLRLHWTTGICNFYGTVIAQGYSCSSDGRFKHNITPVSHALQKIMGLQGVAYDWNSEKFKDRSFSKDRQIGFIAQDVEKVIPELVTTDNDGYKSLDYSKLSVILVEAMKEMNLRTVSLEKENAVLKKRLASLEKISERVAKLENMIKSNTSLASR
ncbi:MAG TPA: tail fiber domain-containing protein [Spirochaetota bacterium]|nr:tail fiber domain-containing protein [Spirochaetota bacterium]HPI90395.1 tail fiber domain-containing protein [Spirochaetota bacterium]HPR48522.1 tail fiber domain-containing protein [Spirochaetota bacterium]